MVMIGYDWVRTGVHDVPPSTESENYSDLLRFDNETDEIHKIGDGIFLCDARMRVEEFNSHSGLEIPTEEFETLGGFVFDLFGKIPVKYEKEVYGRADFVIQSMEGNRIVSVKVVVKQEIQHVDKEVIE